MKNKGFKLELKGFEKSIKDFHREAEEKTIDLVKEQLIALVPDAAAEKSNMRFKIEKGYAILDPTSISSQLLAKIQNAK